MSSTVNNLIWFSSAVVAGIIGACGLFLLSRLTVDHRQQDHGEDAEQLRMQIVSLQSEIQALKELQQKNAQKKRRIRHVENQHNSISYASDTDTADYRSVIGTDIDSDEEYYDLSAESDDDDDVTLTEGLENIQSQFEKSIYAVDLLLRSACSDSDVKEAYEMLIKLKELQNKFTDDQMSEILWRLCRCNQRIVNICEQNNDESRRNDVIEEGIQFGKDALMFNAENANAHKWYAVIVGIRSKGKGTAEKVDDGNTYLHHIQEAIRLNPSDPVLHHLQGRFKYEIASLSWFEKKAASTIFSMPISTFDEALEDFRKAEELIELDWKENRLYVSKCYIGKKDNKEALKWLKSTINIQNKTSDDFVAEAEAKELLSKYE